MDSSPSELSPVVPETLLSKQWFRACVLSTGLFISFLYFLYLNDQHNYIIPYKSSNLAPKSWILLFIAMLFGACLGSFLVKITKLFVILISNGQTVDTHSVVVTLLFMLFASSGLNWFIIFKGSDNYPIRSNLLVEDINGFKTTVFSLVELLVSIPLMYYINIAFDGKEKMSKDDYIIIFLSFTYSIANVLTYYTNNKIIYKLLLIYSLYAIMLAFYKNYNQATKKYNELIQYAPVSPADIMLHRISQQRCENTLYLGLILPIIPLYILLDLPKYFHKYSDLALLLILIFNFIFKNVYAIFLLEEHTELLDPNSFKLLHERTSNDARRNFLRYVFHEVRVPLNSISMGLHLLYNDVIVNNNTNNDNINTIVKSILDTIDMMRESTRLMAETLTDVLSIQKIEEGKLELNFEQFYTDSIVNNVTLSLKQSIASKSIYIDIDIKEDVPRMMMGDRYRIEHVLSNLLSNAIKFSSNNSTIKIIISYGDIVPDHVTYTVIDQGIGISEQDIHMLFSNASNTKHNNISSGVGLTICREIIRLHSGQIGCRSKLRQGNDITSGGSEFYFSIPTKTQENKLYPDLSLKKVISTIMKTRTSQFISLMETNQNNNLIIDNNESYHSYRVLIVDDVKMNRKMLSNILVKKGLQIDMSEDGEECVYVVTSKDIDYYDVIFMDNQMPRMNGLEAAKILREKGYKKIIIGLTGNAMDDDIIEFENAGADIVLAKPLKMTTLEAFLKSCLNNNFQSLIIKDNRIVSTMSTPK